MASFRAKHRRAVEKKRSGVVTLNLVSLTDFFTILLVFLLANSTETEVLTMNSSIKLPESTSHQRPEERTVISVGNDYVVVNSRRVADLSAESADANGVIAGLEAELRNTAKLRGAAPPEGFDVTIMGDREIPYRLLKRIMLTCQATDFANIALAVNRVKGRTEQPTPVAAVGTPDGAGGDAT